MLLTRVVTAALALVAFAAALFLLPQMWWALFLLFMLSIGGWEWAALAGFQRGMRAVYAGFLCVCALALFFAAPRLLGSSQSIDLAVWTVSLTFWIAIAPFWLSQRWKQRNRAVLAAIGWIVLVPMWLAMVRLHPTPWALIMFMSVVWIADTAAYAAGKTWGRNKLAPLISPGKTWEGALGAIGAVMLYCTAVVVLVPSSARDGDSLLMMVLFGAMVVLSIEGDLFESWMKRQAGVKDSGQLLPGHGGVLDRIDGLTAAMPAAALAYYLR